MYKNVDDYIKRDFGDKSLCRDVRIPVGNDSIDPFVCEYMARRCQWLSTSRQYLLYARRQFSLGTLRQCQR